LAIEKRVVKPGEETGITPEIHLLGFPVPIPVPVSYSFSGVGPEIGSQVLQAPLTTLPSLEAEGQAGEKYTFSRDAPGKHTVEATFSRLGKIGEEILVTSPFHFPITIRHEAAKVYLYVGTGGGVAGGWLVESIASGRLVVLESGKRLWLNAGFPHYAPPVAYTIGVLMPVADILIVRNASNDYDNTVIKFKGGFAPGPPYVIDTGARTVTQED